MCPMMPLCRGKRAPVPEGMPRKQVLCLLRRNFRQSHLLQIGRFVGHDRFEMAVRPSAGTGINLVHAVGQSIPISITATLATTFR